MNRELKLFLVAVGIPAVVLLAAALRLVQLEHRFLTHPRPPRAEMRLHHGPGPERDFPSSPLGMRPPRFGVFSPEHQESGERVLWIGGFFVAFMFLSLVSGGWLLVKSAAKARAESLRKTDFLSNISHEFKTPLTTICLCAELAQEEELSPERRRKALQSILNESKRLKDLVLSALDFSRLEKGRRRFAKVPCDLAALAVEVAESMRERFPNGLEIQGAGSKEQGEGVLADPEAVKQIVAIFLDNAAKYAGGWGPVSVTADAHTIAVSDQGPGLDDHGLRHAFDRFWRGDNDMTAETGGSGLGLPIARDLAHGMKGEIVLTRNPEKGLTFTFRL